MPELVLRIGSDDGVEIHPRFVLPSGADSFSEVFFSQLSKKNHLSLVESFFGAAHKIRDLCVIINNYFRVHLQ